MFMKEVYITQTIMMFICIKTYVNNILMKKIFWWWLLIQNIFIDMLMQEKGNSIAKAL